MNKTTVLLLASTLLLMGCGNDNKPQTTPPKKVGAQVLPPAYLTIKGSKNCMGTKSMGNWKSVCIPKAQPKDCEKDSWNKLNALQGTDRPPACD